MTRAGYREETFGTQESPVVKYLPADESLPADVEFLCPLSGLPGGRKMGAPVSHPVQEGLVAQPLRYLELLLHRTWEIDLGCVPDFAQMKGAIIRIPNPAAYVVQKVLIREERRSEPSAAKDCYYIYEVSVIFRNCLETLAREYAELQKAYASWGRKFPRQAGALFAKDSAAGVTSALRVFSDAALNAGRSDVGLTAEMIYRSVSKLLGALK